MDNQRELQIILRARDDASKTIGQVANTTDSLSESFKRNFKEAGLMASGVIAGFGLMARSAVENAASYEQIRISFESMLGSAGKAQTLLKQVSDFAQQTPFELPQVAEGAKRLLAYNIEAGKIIPTFKMLGDIAAGVGTDKLPQLITAFGQVQSKGKLMGTELLQFTEAGVGLLDALVKKANENGGMLITTTKGTKMTAEATEKMNSQLAISKKRLEETTATGKAKESTLMSLRAKIGEYEGKLGEASKGQQTFTSKVKVTREQMQDMISDGKVTAKQVEEALSGMTSKGWLFFEGMERQSKSFNGVMSNISDNFGKFVREIVGISDTGDIRDGSLFAYLKVDAERFLVILDQVRPGVTRFVNELVANKSAVMALGGAVGGLLVLALGALIATIGPAVLVMTTFAAAGAGLVMLFTNFEAVLKVVAPQLLIVVGAITAVNLATLGLSGSVSALFGLIAAHPLGMLAIALAAAAGGVVYLATQTDFLKTKNDLLRDAQDELKRSTDELTGHQQTLQDHYRELERLGLVNERNQRNYNAAVKQFGHDSLEAREAMLTIKDTQDRFKDIQSDVNIEMAKSPKILADHDKALRESNKVAQEAETTWGKISSYLGDALNKYAQWSSTGAGKLFGIGVPRFAGGTDFAPGGMALVGERGPELVNLPRGSEVIPNGQTQNIMNRNQSVQVGPVYVQSMADVDSMAYRLGFHLQTAGNL